jgi:hypothetical protein
MNPDRSAADADQPGGEGEQLDPRTPGSEQARQPPPDPEAAGEARDIPEGYQPL